MANGYQKVPKRFLFKRMAVHSDPDLQPGMIFAL
jgi:hypothetical protein